MKVLFDIVHPADVLFFLHPIRQLKSQGVDVMIVSRHKDVTCDLLDQFGLNHRPASTAGIGYFGLGKELIQRNLAIWRVTSLFRPDVMVGFGGVSISHVGKLTGIPAISFYAADTAGLQTRLTWPFIAHLYVPQAYAGTVPEGRTSRFPGIKELSYFHPNNFSIDDGIAQANGWDPTQRNFFIRMVSWRANHDIGKAGWDDATLQALVDYLSRQGKVHISSERPLPGSFAQFAYRGAKNQVHHVMGKCDLYVGESATMAHEACLLGAPAIYDGADHPGTTRQLESHKLLIALRQPGLKPLLAAVERQLLPGVREQLLIDRAAYFAKCANLTDYIVNRIKEHGID